MIPLIRVGNEILMFKLKVFINGSQLNMLAAMKKLTKIFQYNKYKISSGLTNVFYDCAC